VTRHSAHPPDYDVLVLVLVQALVPSGLPVFPPPLAT
jgi:hypothetical protein